MAGQWLDLDFESKPARAALLGLLPPFALRSLGPAGAFREDFYDTTDRAFWRGPQRLTLGAVDSGSGSTRQTHMRLREHAGDKRAIRKPLSLRDALEARRYSKGGSVRAACVEGLQALGLPPPSADLVGVGCVLSHGERAVLVSSDYVQLHIVEFTFSRPDATRDIVRLRLGSSADGLATALEDLRLYARDAGVTFVESPAAPTLESEFMTWCMPAPLASAS